VGGGPNKGDASQGRDILRESLLGRGPVSEGRFEEGEYDVEENGGHV
jgi:hypothetical protein